MIHFKTFYVHPKDVEGWPHLTKGYKVLALDVEKTTEQVLPEPKPKGDVNKMLEDEDDDEHQEQIHPDDMETVEQIVMFVLLGNPGTKEIQWFDVKDVEFVGF